MTEYVLGTHEGELARLELQQGIWRHVTDRFFDRIGVKSGWRCLDVGCGPGFVTQMLAERVGPTGSVVALDLAEHWLAKVASDAEAAGRTNVTTRRGSVTELADEGAYDLVFARWVLSFVPDATDVVRRMARAASPGGVVAVQDYNHEGVSIFPESRGMRAAIRATRELYVGSAGDPWVAGKLRGAMLDAGLTLTDFTPMVMAGGPDSDAFRWADAFFPRFVGSFVEDGLMSEEERALFDIEWRQRLADPRSTFFSPIVVDVAGTRPG